MCFMSFLYVSEVEVVLPFSSFLYLSIAGMLCTIIPCICLFLPQITNGVSVLESSADPPPIYPRSPTETNSKVALVIE